MLGMITVTVTRNKLEDIDFTRTMSLSSFISTSPGIRDVCMLTLNVLSLRERDDNFAYLTHAHTLAHQDVILISLRVSAHSSAPCGAVFGRSRL
jgi:hypothetical protein